MCISEDLKISYSFFFCGYVDTLEKQTFVQIHLLIKIYWWSDIRTDIRFYNQETKVNIIWTLVWVCKFAYLFSGKLRLGFKSASSYHEMEPFVWVCELVCIRFIYIPHEHFYSGEWLMSGTVEFRQELLVIDLISFYAFDTVNKTNISSVNNDIEFYYCTVTTLICVSKPE